MEIGALVALCVFSESLALDHYKSHYSFLFPIEHFIIISFFYLLNIIS